MTAPLPPPDIIDANYGNLYTERKVKLAVREALEQLLTETRPSVAIGSRAAARIRAMIEEYR